VASGLLPERAGQPVKVRAHVSLAELRVLDDGSVPQGEWIGEMAVRWAAHRAAASQAGGDGAPRSTASHASPLPEDRLRRHRSPPATPVPITAPRQMTPAQANRPP
jgi:hypothetical protein